MNSHQSRDFLRASLGVAIGQICHSLGWHSVHRSSHDILTDILERYLKQVSVTTANHTQFCCRTEPNLHDVSFMFEQLGIGVHELEDYVQQVDSTSPANILSSIPQLSKHDLLCFSIDEQFPPIVDVKQEEEIQIDVQDELTEEVTTSMIQEEKINRPKDLVIRKSSVESPPYSPLEPKSLNIDAQANTDLTRPGLVVTTPKGYTPTVTTDIPSCNVTSITDSAKPLFGSEKTDSRSILSPKENTCDRNQSPNRELVKSKTVKKKLHDKKNKESQKSPNKSLKSPLIKQKKNNANVLSPSRNAETKKKSPKVQQPTVGLKDILKSPELTKKIVAKQSKKTEELCIKKEPQELSESLDLPHSPPVLIPSPHVLQSPVRSDKHSSPASEAREPSIVKEEQSSLLTQPLTSPQAESSSVCSQLKQLTPPLFSPKNLLSPRKGEECSVEKSEPSGSVSPLPTSMPVLTYQKQQDGKNGGVNSNDMEVDVISVVKEEKNSPVQYQFTPDRSSERADEKKKKKKKKSDRDKERKHDFKEKKDKKKKREGREREAEEDSSSVPIPKLTLRMGNETISNPTSKLFGPSEPSLDSLEPSPPHSLKTSTKKPKKESKHKEKAVISTGGFYVETLTNTASSLGEDIYYCPACSRPDDGSPMIGCDSCDLWYHWPCVGINNAPADDIQWFCPKCLSGPPAKKKKKKKKKEF